MRSCMQRATLAFLCLVGITGCAPHPQRMPRPASIPVSGFPEEFYREARASGEPVFAIESPELQSVKVRVHREGSLASLGHDHIISAQDVRGYVLDSRDPSRTRVDVYLPVAALEVDLPASTADAGIARGLSQEDIAATRRHMLEDVLQSEKYPYVVVHGVCSASPPPCRTLDARVTLHGVTRDVAIPIAVEMAGDRLVVSGDFSVRHSEYGMTPYSVFGGALRVGDKIDVSFRLEAGPTAH